MTEWTDQDRFEWYEERVAIMTIDGGATEEQAAWHAYMELKRMVGAAKVPQSVKDAVKAAKSKGVR